MGIQLATFLTMATVMNAISHEHHGKALPGLPVALSMSAPLLASIALYMAWRYGWRQARLAGVLATVAFTATCFQRAPHVTESAAAVLAALIAVAMAARTWRRVTRNVLAALALSGTALVLLVMLANLTTHRPILPFPVNYIAVVTVQWIAFRYWPPEPVPGEAVGTSLQ
jgi:hypothetical protein